MSFITEPREDFMYRRLQFVSNQACSDAVLALEASSKDVEGRKLSRNSVFCGDEPLNK